MFLSQLDKVYELLHCMVNVLH